MLQSGVMSVITLSVLPGAILTIAILGTALSKKAVQTLYVCIVGVVVVVLGCSPHRDRIRG